MKKRTCQRIAIILMTLLTGTICACGKKPPVDIMGSEEDDQRENKESLKERIGVPNEVKHQLQTGITITLDVDMPDCTSVGIYELEMVDLTTNYMDGVCKKIFDNGTYQILWPSYIYTKEELQEKVDVAGGEVLGWTDEGFHSHFLRCDWIDALHRVETWKEGWENYVVSDPGNDLVLYPSPARDYSGIEEIQDNIYNDPSIGDPDYVRAEGTIHDKLARMIFMKANDRIQVAIEMEKDAYSWNTEYTKEYAETIRIKETFVYTEEAAIQMAADYIDQFGLAGYEPINVSYLAEHDENFNFQNELGSLTGYRITFGLCKNDVSMLYDSYYEGIIIVDIGAEGLMRISLRNPYMIVSTLTENSELLTFDQICAIADEKMTDMPELYIDLNKLEFGYVIENYDDGAVLIPVWRYVNDNVNLHTSFAYFMINAVDGSIVEPKRFDDMDYYFWY